MFIYRHTPTHTTTHTNTPSIGADLQLHTDPKIASLERWNQCATGTLLSLWGSTRVRGIPANLFWGINPGEVRESSSALELTSAWNERHAPTTRANARSSTNPELAEAIAFRRAINFALQLPYNQVMVATDCLSLVHKLQSKTTDRSYTEIIIQDIKEAARSSSIVFSFIHVSRWCNEVAHVLARSASRSAN